MSSSSNPPRQRRPASRAVPQMSYAYGAPTSSNGGGRQSVGPSAAALNDDSRGSASPTRSTSARQATLSPQPPTITARERYERLKAKQAAGGDGRSTGLAPRRSPRNSAAGSIDQEGAASRRAAAGTIEEDEEPESDADAAAADSVKQIGSRPTASVSSAHASSHSASRTGTAAGNASFGTTRGSARGRAKDVSSYFVQQPSLSPTPDDDDAGSASGLRGFPSSLLRGAQRPSHDPLTSPHQTGMTSISLMSSDGGGESRSFYDYAGEEAFANRIDGQGTPRQPTSWLKSISPWGASKRKAGEESIVNGHAAGGDQAGESSGELTGDGSSPRKAMRRKGRTSKDNLPYRPPKGLAEDEEEDDTDDSTSGRKVGHGRRRVSDKSRAGRDDNKIWKAKKRKGAKKGKGGEGEEDDEDEEGEEEGDEETGSSGELGSDAGETTVGGSSQDKVKRAPKKRSSTGRRVASSSGFALGNAAAALRKPWVLLPLAGALGATLLSSGDGPGIGLDRLLNRSAPAFTAPKMAPASFDALISRLTSVEGAVQGLSNKVGRIGDSLDARERVAEELQRRVVHLESGSRKAAKQIEGIESQLGAHLSSEQRIESLEREGRKFREEMTRLSVQLRDAEARVAAQENRSDASEASSAKASDAEVTKLSRRINALDAKLRSTDAEVATISKRTAEARAVADKAKSALTDLERHLPERMPVRLDERSGKIKIEAAFWEELRRVFADKKDIEAAIKSKGKGSAAAPPESGVPAPSSWAAFTAANGDALEALITQYADGRISASVESGLIVSKERFLEVLSSELDKAKRALEVRFNENAEGLQNDVLKKVRMQQDMYEKSGSWGGGAVKKGSAQQPAAEGSSAPWWAKDSISSDIELKLKDGTDAKSAVVALIDAALDSYSADRIARADFALFSGGARIIPSLTSPTYTKLVERSAFARLLGLGRGVAERASIKGRSPAVAIHHDTALGMCWPFAGDEGQLGIALSRRTVVTDITIEHVARSVALERDLGTAPRDISVWGLVERKEDVERLAAHRALAEARKASSPEMDGDDFGEPIPAPPSPQHLHLASFAYDALSPSSRALQTFSVSPEARALRIPVGVVQVRIASNHGSKDYTCLYRVRVHGEEWTGA